MVLFCTTFHALAQTEFFLGPGFGANRNKKVVESDTKKYRLMPFNQDYKIELGARIDPHFYLHVSYNVYRQDIESMPVNDPVYPSMGTPNTSYVNFSYNNLSYYIYQGIMAVPCFITGDKASFFVGAGINLDFSRIDGSKVLISEDHYHYDSLGNFAFDYTNHYDTTNQLIQRKGSDFSLLFETGGLFHLGSTLALQVTLYFRRSLVLKSLEAEGDYKSNAGLAVSIFYRLWSRTNPTPQRVE